MRPFATLFVGLVLFAARANADVACPLNTMSAGSLLVTSSLSSDSRSKSDCGAFGCSNASASYDIPAAWLSTSATSTGDAGANGEVIVQDQFHVVRPSVPNGTPISITARLHVVVSGPADGYIEDELGNQQVSGTFGTFDLDLPLAVTVGQTFTLKFEVRAFSSAFFTGASGTATFSFLGVPTGAAVVSCNGYVSDKAVATKPASWGQLKSWYR